MIKKINFIKFAMLIFIMAMIISPAVAEFYKWVDQNGVTRYTDTPPPEKAKSVKTFETSSTSGSSAGLTPEQCSAYKKWGRIKLTPEQEESVKSSCRQRYSSTHALDNCFTFELDDKRKELEKLAKTTCK